VAEQFGGFQVELGQGVRRGPELRHDRGGPASASLNPPQPAERANVRNPATSAPAVAGTARKHPYRDMISRPPGRARSSVLLSGRANITGSLPRTHCA